MIIEGIQPRTWQVRCDCNTLPTSKLSVYRVAEKWIHLLRAIQMGADGVYVVGCLEGTCHYNEGNFRARERVEHVRRLLEEIGMDGDRVRMYNLSSGEGPTFAAYAKEMTEHIMSLGPSPLDKYINAKKG